MVFFSSHPKMDKFDTNKNSAVQDQNSLANAAKQRQKLLQVVQNFFTKVLQLIVLSRSVIDTKSPQNASASKINKWFNLCIASLDDETVRHEIRQWKLHPDLALFPPMIIETCLDLSQLNPHEYVVLEDDSRNVWPVSEGQQKEIVVERWLVKFDSSAGHSRPPTASDELPLMYKQAIILLRTIYLLVRLLPSYKLRKLVSKPSSRNLTLVNHFLDGSQPVTSRNRIGLSKPIIPQHLLTESHLTQRDFTPIETSYGVLSVSVVYRSHHKFRAQDQEERLSRQFVTSDNEKAESAFHGLNDEDIFPKPSPVSSALSQRVVVPPSQRLDTKTPLKGSFEQFRERFLVLPCTSEHLERPQMLPPRGANFHKSAGQNRPNIQLFRVGSIGSNSPPHQGSHSPIPSHIHGSLMERRVSITSNRSGSNASLVALLRNPRGSNSSSTPAATMAIAGSQTNTVSLPRSIASSHGSHLPGNDDMIGEIVGTPKFLSSFGSRQSRRFSSTSAKAAGQHSEANNSFMGTSLDLGLLCAPSSGLYIDDDISSFVRMIDGKSELRLSISTNNSDSRLTPPSHESQTPVDALNRFHLLKSQYQQLGDSVNASLVLQKHHSSRDNQSIDERLSGSRLVNSGISGISVTPGITGAGPMPSPYDNTRLPSISSRLSDVTNDVGLSNQVSQRGSPKQHSPDQNQQITRRNQGSHGSQSLLVHSVHGHVLADQILNPTAIITSHGGLAPTSLNNHGSSNNSYKVSSQKGAKIGSDAGRYEKSKEVHYHDVFEDDDEGHDFFHAQHDKRSNAHDMEFDNDDLLFEMTDTK